MKTFITVVAVLLAAWNAVLMLSIAATFLGFIWGVPCVTGKIVLGLPMAAVAFLSTYKTIKRS